MKHKLKYSTEDAAEFSKVAKMRGRKYLGHDRVEFFMSFLLWVLIAIGFLTSISFYLKAHEYRNDINVVLVYMLIVGLLIWGLWARRMSRYRKVAYSVDGLFLTEKEVEMTDEGIFFTSKYGSHRYNYESISDIIVSQRNMYLFVDNFQAIIVPKGICDEQYLLEKIPRQP